MVGSYELLLGDEAVAWGAVDSGILGAFAYPGTPSTEILETIQDVAPSVWANWSANEKVAYEEALGMSYLGGRSLVSMKHVGLNVASDPFMSSALTGVNGGLVLAVADDPSMHSSQSEQDSRFFADFARIPCFEPSTQQDCYDMTREAFRWSEKFELPVMIRLVTRLAHSRSLVRRAEPELHPVNQSAPLPNPNDWSLMPVNARRRYRRLLDMQGDLRTQVEAFEGNRLKLGGKRGIICSSTGFNYVREALGENPQDSLLRIAAYPLPDVALRRIIDHCDEIYVFEDGFPFIERHILGLYGVHGKSIHGRLDGTLREDGELLPETVARALGVDWDAPDIPDPLAVNRPPQFCKGCPHAYTYDALVDATAGYERPLFFSDIGCYALGIAPPYSAVHSVVDMGASIGMAHGASRTGAFPVICTIGDSTFAHSGLPALLGAVHHDADITVMVLDNSTTAMTGQQDSFATGEELVEMLRGLGVKDLHIFEPIPKNREANVQAIRAAIEHRGLSVIVARRACIHFKKPKLVGLPVCEGI